MKKRKFPIIKSCFHLAIIITVACSSDEKKNSVIKPEKQERIENVNLIDNTDNIAEAFYLSDIVDSIEIVQLEINPNHLFAEDRINNLFLTDNDIFFYETKSGLLKYNRLGEFQQQIGKIGKGPGEYLLIRNYYVDETLQTITAYLNWKGKLVSYDFEGKLLAEVKPPLLSGIKGYSGFYRLGNYHLAEHFPAFSEETSDTSQVFNFVVADSLFHEIKTLTDPSYKNYKQDILDNKYDPWDSWANFYQIDPPRLKFRDTYMDLMYPGNDTIYRLTHKLQTELRYIVNTGKKMPFEMLHLHLPPLEYFDYLSLLDFEETANYLFIDFAWKKNFYKARFQKSTGQVDMLKKPCEIQEKFLSGRLYTRRRDGKKPSFTDDMLGTGEFRHQWTNQQNWICAIPAYKLLELDLDSLKKAEVKQPSVRDKLVQKIQNIKETDGPILLVAHLKNAQSSTTNH